MRHLTLAAFAAFSPAVVFANTVWKGPCRPVVNEAGEVIKQSPTKSLQSSYVIEGTNFVWTVASFTDTGCAKLFDANRYTHRCALGKPNTFRFCERTGWEHTGDGSRWMKRAMVDHAGYPMSEKLQIKTKPVGKTLQLTTLDEAEEPLTEVLKR